MPAAIPIIVTYVVTSVIGITTFKLGTAIAIAFLAQFTAQIQEGRNRRPEIDLGARLQQSFLERASRRIIYGKVRTAPQPIAHAANSNWSGIIYAICDHDFERIDNLYINNGLFLTPDEINTLNADGQVDVSNTTSHDLTTTGGIRERYGDPGDRVDKTLTRFAIARPGELEDVLISSEMGINEWEIDISSMAGTGTSFIIAYYPSPSRIGPVRRGERQGIFSGVPNLQVDIDRGGRDLAELPSTYRVSSTAYNTARALYDYASKYTDFGVQIFGQDRIDFASFSAAVTACETENYRAHGVVTLTDSNEIIFEQFMLAMGAGWIGESGGVLHVRANTTLAATHTITADHVQPDWTIVPQTPRTDRFTDILIQHIDDSAKVNTVSYHLQDARDQFGEREQTIEADFIRGTTQAYQLAQILAQRAYHASQVELTLDATGLAVNPGDVVDLDVDQMGLDHESLFVVVNKVINPEITVQLGLAEYVPPPAQPTLLSVMGPTAWDNGTSTLTNIRLEIPQDFIPAEGSPVSPGDTIHWEGEFVFDDDPNPTSPHTTGGGYSSGTDDQAFGSVASGTNRVIPANTIPGITGQRTVSLAAIMRRSNGQQDIRLGWEPDEESSDQGLINSGDVRVRFLEDDIPVYDAPFSVVQTRSTARDFVFFQWDNRTRLNASSVAITNGDTFKVQIYTRDVDFYDGAVLREMSIGAQLVSPGGGVESTPNYAAPGFARLRFHGALLPLPAGAIPPDLRAAIIDVGHPTAGQNRLLLDCGLAFPGSAPGGGFQLNLHEFNNDCFHARVMDTSRGWGVDDGDVFRVVLYRASGPLPIDLLEG